MKTDADIRRDVELELQWEPSVDDRQIGVIVNNGIVTLTVRSLTIRVVGRLRMLPSE